MENMKKKKRKVKRKIFYFFFFFLLVVAFSVGVLYFLKESETKEEVYLASASSKVTLLDENQKEIELPRGTKVWKSSKKETIEEKEYIKLEYQKKTYYTLTDVTVKDLKEAVQEKEKFVRTSLVLYEKPEDISIVKSVKKGEALEITGFDQLNEDGTVTMYQVKHGEDTGYVYAKYLVDSKEEALKNYDEENTYQIHKARGDRYNGGDAGALDYYPEEKIKIEGNEMPKEVRSLYINAAAIKDVDQYIAVAKDANINAFVVDIKDNTTPAYDSDVYKELSPTNYKKALNKKEDYKNYIQKLKDNGFYVIGRITAFKDDYYAQDHKESAILDTRTGSQFVHNHSYWPSAFSRDVWEFNVRLAIEAVKEMGFHEIQFDYVRFPDGTTKLEKSGVMDLRNTYEEDKAQAIQQFLMYARDEIHKAGAYISADVFGESANQYVTAYGQYWPAISNVVDVISAMPYPDHFNTYEYGFKVPVWTIPYELLKTWSGEYAAQRQKEIPTPAIGRTWIQAYNSIKSPYVTYDASKMEEQIKGLYEGGLTGGYITWSANSSLEKYKQIAPAFRKDYLS